MIGQNRNRESDERLDQVGRQVIRVSAANEAEGEAAASSPFLYARLRARIADERKRLEEGERWRALLGIVWRSAPALALVAVFAFALFWSVSLSTRTPRVLSDEALFDARDADVERVVFADRRAALSNDEVLATILNEDEREASR